MQVEATYNNNQLRDYSFLFSRNEALLWLKKDFTSINYKIERYDEKWQNFKKATYLDYLKYVYSILESHYRNEYIFKNAFLNDWLIDEIGEQDSKVYNEFRIGNAVADLVMFNGNSKIFEIKTEFDSDSRLALQLENYRKAFNQIFLIVPESKLCIYEKYDKMIGLISFTSNKTNRFHLHREAGIILELDSATIMDILHTEEYKSIVKLFYGSLPKMTSFNQFNVCGELIEEIPSIELNDLFISQMKKRGFKNVLSNRCFKEFNQLSLALKMNKFERTQMIEILKTPLQF